MGHNVSQPSLTPTIGRILGAFVLLLLFAGTLHAQSVTLGWNANTETNLTGYTLYYGTASGVYPSSVSVGLATTYTLSGLVPGQRYYFAVKASNSSGLQSAFSAEVNAVVATSVPSTPTTPSPASGGTGVSTSTTLTWSASGATSYAVKFGTTNPPSQVATGLTSASYAPSGLTTSKTYYWQIVATNSAGSTTGPVWSFTTSSTASAPTTPTSASPATGATGVSTGTSLTWSAGGASSYTIRLGTTNPPPQVVTGMTNAFYKPATLAAGTKYYWQIVAVNSTGSATGSVWSFTTAAAPPAATPTLDLDTTTLMFAATKAGATGGLLGVTPAQAVRVSVNATTPAWTVTANAPWVHISTSSGTGTGQFSVSISDPTNNLGASTNVGATVTVTAGTLVRTVSVSLTVDLSGVDAPPFGAFDTPADGATGVVGSIPVTGWALDDIGVQRVQLWRNCVNSIDRPLGACAAAAPGGPADFVYIADAAFLSGARPDVEALNPTLPQAHRAGWGYLMSGNALPDLVAGTPQGGQGTFTLSAYVIDVQGQYTLLGTKTIALDNDHATIPFGAIDTPDQGGTITAPVYANFGWAMTQNPKCIDTTSTASYKVYIDGVSRPLALGSNWFPGLNRSDIAAAYPGLCNSNNALAASYIDTVALGLTNGLHTLGWDVIDNQGRVAGIGSRFFNVLVGSGQIAGAASGEAASGQVTTAQTPSLNASDRPVALGNASQLSVLTSAERLVRVRVGGDLAPVDTMTRDSNGRYAVQFPAESRIAFDFGGAVDAGYQIVGDEIRELPGGSTLDTAGGQFAWQPPVPFLGQFHLVFVSGSERLDVLTTITDPTATVGIAMHVDTPAADSTVNGSFVVAGWALDTAATTGSGIDTLHVWAYRRDGIALPQFVGAAAVGGARPDVGAIYGEQFDAAGFTLTTSPLAPGTYDLVVYPWSHRTGQFGQATAVRVVVR